jgi:hypothetical protein
MSEQILKALDKVEQNYSVKMAEFGDRILNLEQSGSAHLGERLSTSSQSLGAQVAAAYAKNSEILAKSKSLRIEIKAATDVISTTSGRSNFAGGVGSPGVSAMIGVQNALSVRAAPGASVSEYFRFSGTQGGASIQAGEGAQKSAVRPDHQLVVQSSLTVAGYSKISRQALNDSAELQAAINVTLRRSIASALDSALNVGNVSPAWDGLLALATGFASNYTSLVDAVSHGVSEMQLAGFVPDAVALNPGDWLAITVQKGTDGHPLSGAYLGVLPEAMRGLKVVLSPTVPLSKALLIDSGQIEMLVSDDFAVEFGYTNDDFTKNLIVILGETRVIPVYRSYGAALLITHP